MLVENGILSIITRTSSLIKFLMKNSARLIETHINIELQYWPPALKLFHLQATASCVIDSVIPCEFQSSHNVVPYF